MPNAYVEPRPKGRPAGDPITGYVVEDHADSVLHETATQADAEGWARANGYTPLVARVRHLNDKAKPDLLREAD